MSSKPFLFSLINRYVCGHLCQYVSFLFQKVHSLQRCLTYRLGNRLPLKGPGYILKLPFIDHISIIDLYEEHFNIIDSEEQILTGIFQMDECQLANELFCTVR